MIAIISEEIKFKNSNSFFASLFFCSNNSIKALYAAKAAKE